MHFKLLTLNFSRSKNVDPNQQQNQQKGQNQQKAQPGVGVVLPVGLNDIDRPDTMARVSIVGIAVGVGAIALAWLFAPFKRICFPQPAVQATPTIDMSNPAVIAQSVVSAGTGRAKGTVHEIMKALSKEDAQALVENLNRNYGVKESA
jgi:hypothetical protein